MGRVDTMTPSTMDTMARLLPLTALTGLLVTLACANTPEPGGSGSSTTTGQSAGATGAGDSGEPTAAATKRSGADQPGARVPVATAQRDGSCERMCGSVGDCLREGGDVSDAGHVRDAVHLELTCLDLCVNVDATSEVGKRFRACEGRDACDPLLSCARKDWDAAAKARGTVFTQIDAAPSYDTCELVCGGMYSCMYHDRPLQQLRERGQQFEQDVASCMRSCEPDTESMMALALCTHEDTCAQQWECWQQAQNY